MPTIEEIKEKTRNIFMLYPIRKVTLFGSYARGTQNTESDIDFLIIDSDLSILEASGLKEQLAEALNKNVDIISDTDISNVFRFLIKDEEVIVYENRDDALLRRIIAMTTTFCFIMR